MAERLIRIAQLTLSIFSGGTEERVARILRGLDRAEFEPMWIGFGEAGPILERAGPGVKAILLREKAKGIDVAAIGRIARILKRERPDVLHVHNWATSIYGIAAARLAGVRAVIYGNGGRDRPEVPSKRQSAVARALAPHVDRFTAVSEQLAEEMTETWAIPRGVIEVIRTGIAVESIVRAGDRAGARAAIGLPLDAKVIGTIAQIRPVKRLDDLILAASMLAAHDPRVHLVIVGGTAERAPPEFLRALPGASVLGERLHLTGRREDYASLFAAFDVFVNCSVFEGISNAILEAMAASLPVVATAVGGTPELVLSGRTGVLVPPRAPDALAAALRSLLQDPALAVRFGRAGYDHVAARHALPAMIVAYASLYRNVARRRSMADAIAGFARGAWALI